MFMSVTVPVSGTLNKQAITLTQGLDSEQRANQNFYTINFKGDGIDFSVSRAQLKAALEAFDLTRNV